MNITETFRRKNKYHKPIIVFKQLYRDYFKQSPKSPENMMKMYRVSEGTQCKSPRYQNHKLTPHEQLRKLSNDLTYKNRDEKQAHINLSKTSSAQDMTKYLIQHGENVNATLGGYSFNKDCSMKDTTLRRSKSTQNNTFVFKLLERSQLEGSPFLKVR